MWNLTFGCGRDQDKCEFGMQALKASMDWDERVYGANMTWTFSTLLPLMISTWARWKTRG